jgi:toxin YoeB
MPEQPPFTVRITRRAQKDIEKLAPKLRRKLREVLTNRIAEDPTSGKKLTGDLSGYWSVRLTYQDRIVYRIDEENRVVFILRARTHYRGL